MLISTPQEFRLYAPAHAYDDITPLLGTLAISEADFLAPVLGNALYDTLCAHYANILQTQGIDNFVSSIQMSGDGVMPYADQLLHLSQRCIVFDTLSRVADMQALSIHASGINVSVADDYKAPDAELIRAYKAQASREAHTSLNILLQRLEGWAKAADSIPYAELWREDSHYYYLVNDLIFPSATVLNEYLPNFYENRERFISLIPDIRAVQEDILAPVIGDDVIDFFVSIPTADDVTGQSFSAYVDSSTSLTPVIFQAQHRLRKASARLLEERLLRNKPRNVTSGAAISQHQATINQAHQEAIALIESFVSYLQRKHQQWISSSQSSSGSASECPISGPLLDALSVSPLSSRFVTSPSAKDGNTSTASSSANDGESSPSSPSCDHSSRRSLFALPIMN